MVRLIAHDPVAPLSAGVFALQDFDDTAHDRTLVLLIGGLYADLGVSDEVIAEAVTGGYEPTGQLPCGLPESMASVVQGDLSVPGHPDQP